MDNPSAIWSKFATFKDGLPQVSDTKSLVPLLLVAALAALFILSRKHLVPRGGTSAPPSDEPWNKVRDAALDGGNWKQAGKQIHVMWFDLNREGKVSIAVAATILLTIASFYTTLNGIANFSNFLVAILAAAGIQLTLYIGAWIVAEGSASKHYLKQLRRKHKHQEDNGGEYEDDENLEAISRAKLAAGSSGIWAWALFWGAFFVSVFFSYDALFDTVYGEKERVLNNNKVARSEISKAFSSMAGGIEEDRRIELESLRDSKEWKKYEEDLTVILRVAATSKDIIQKELAADRSKIEAELKPARAEMQRQDEAVKTLEAKIDVVTTRPDVQKGFANDEATQVGRLQTRQSDTQTRIDALEKQRSETLGRRDAEAGAGGKKGDGTRRLAGRGPVWKSLNADLIEIMANLNAAKADLKQIKNELAGARSAQETALTTGKTLSSRLETERTKLKELQNKVREIESRYRLATAGQGADAARQASNAVATGFGVESFKKDFLGGGSREAYGGMTDRCNQLRKILEGNNATKSQLGGASCSTSAFQPRVEKLENLDEAFRTFRADCKVDDKFNAMNVPQLVAKGRSCAAISTLPFDKISIERAAIEKVETENSADTSHFVRDISTLMRGDYQSWLALAIAFFIDFLVLAAAMLGARASADPLTRYGTIAPAEAEAMAIAQEADLHIYEGDPTGIRNQKILLALAGDREGRINLDRAPAEFRNDVAGLLRFYRDRRLIVTDQQGVDKIDKDLFLKMKRQIGQHEISNRRLHGPRDKADGREPCAPAPAPARPAPPVDAAAGPSPPPGASHQPPPGAFAHEPAVPPRRVVPRRRS